MFTRPTPLVLTYTLTRAEFTEKQKALAKMGIDAAEDSGTITHTGITAEYKYEEPTLTVTVTHHPMLLTDGLIQKYANEWFA